MWFSHLPYKNADNLNEENEDLDQLREEIAAWPGIGDELKSRSDLPDKLHNFLRRILSAKPEERPSTAEILQSIKAGTAFNEYGSFSPTRATSGADDLRTRVQPLGYPTLVEPGSNGSVQRRPTALVRPGFPKSRPSSGDTYASKSPSLHATSVTDSSLSPTTFGPSNRPFKALMAPPAGTRRAQISRLMEKPSILVVGKILLFGLKVVSISRPCFPVATKSWIFYPLLGLAAIDLTSTVKRSKDSIVLILLHIIIIAISARLDILCEQSSMSWEAGID